MGTVWRVRHARAGFDAALKVLSRATGQQAALRALFRGEVRALARLTHPAIVGVLDQGRATAAESEVAPPGTPWIVMELVEGGTLEDQAAPLDWAGTAGVLRRVLAALAHAHAHGLLHRDVKPNNVLLPQPGAFSQARLVDFGLARPLEEDRVPLRRMAEGTPAFMAPEQVRAEWRRFGPATDLYGVGCLAWTLITAAHPFRGDTRAVLQAHVSAPLPPLVPRFAVPPELRDWLHWLLEKDPAARPPLAAVAAAGLASLGAPTGAPGVAMGGIPAAAPTLVPGGDSGGWTVGATLAPLDIDGLQPPQRLPAEPAPAAAPARPRLVPVPSDWRSTESPRAQLPPGLGVLALRRAPLLGREQLRDQLWAELAQVGAGGPRLVVLEGPSGVGKSRLAEWLCERAHAAGCAGTLAARHGPVPGPEHGPTGMLARHLRVAGLEGEAVLDHLARRLGPHRSDPQIQALAERLAPQDPPRTVFLDPAERRRPLASALRLLAQNHPLVVWLDDVQWGLEAISLAADLAATDAAVLVVLVAESAALAGRPVEQERLTQLDAARWTVATLGRDSQRQLLHAHLGLDPALVRDLDARTAGNPLFALQLVEDQVELGNLEEGALGWRLRPGVSAALPDNLHQVWVSRVQPIIAATGEPGRDALEIAASLGASVGMAEWQQACGHAGVSTDLERLVELLAARALAVIELAGQGRSWRPVHGMLRESIERVATEAGRAPRWHQACAAALGPGRASAERRAHHLIEAGDRHAAVQPLLDAAEARFEADGHRAAGPLLARARDLMGALGLSHDAPERVRLDYLDLRMARLAGDYPRANQLAAPAIMVARARGWPPECLRLAAEAADVARLQGRLSDAWELLQEVEPLADDDPAAAGMIAQRIGTVCFERGDGEQTIAWARKARARFLAAGDGVSATTSLTLVGVGLARLERFTEAAARFQEAVEEHSASGCRWGTADTLNNLGWVRQKMGDPDGALAAYARSIACGRRWAATCTWCRGSTAGCCWPRPVAGTRPCPASKRCATPSRRWGGRLAGGPRCTPRSRSASQGCETGWPGPRPTRPSSAAWRRPSPSTPRCTACETWHADVGKPQPALRENQARASRPAGLNRRRIERAPSACAAACTAA